MKVLEIGNYIVPAYAGMILAEQGHDVEKWINGRDPILSLHRGDELWSWINEGKHVVERDVAEITARDLSDFDVVIDNFKPSTLARLEIEPSAIAARFRLAWVSMRSEIGEASFDLLAQTRSWMGDGMPWMPFYIGDTSAGLWLAFKALSCFSRGVFGHFVLGHASCLQKLMEGELVIDQERNARSVPWDNEKYVFVKGRAFVEYKGMTITETPKSREWRRRYLWHNNGRIII